MNGNRNITSDILSELCCHFLSDAPYQRKEKALLDAINTASQQDKTTTAQHAFDRMPESFSILTALWSFQRDRLGQQMPALLKREILKNMDRAVHLYCRTCSIVDVNRADELLKEMVTISEQVAAELKYEEKAYLTTQVEKLRSVVETMNDKTEDDSKILRQLEKIDESIMKDRLEIWPEVKKKYEDATEKLIKAVGKNDDSEGKALRKSIEQYNLQAIEYHQKAIELFEKDVSVFNAEDFSTGKDMNLLIDLVGGWDTQFLFPATMSYTNTIFGTIFSKIKKQVQFDMTKAMIEAPKKSIESVAAFRKG